LRRCDPISSHAVPWDGAVLACKHHGVMHYGCMVR